MLWWLSHMTRIVMKLVTKAKKDCHSLIRPSDNETPDVDGSRRFRTSKVIAKAKTPSLKASVLAVSCASRLPTVSMGRKGLHASGRFESAAGAEGKSASSNVTPSSRSESRNTAVVFGNPQFEVDALAVLR